MKTEVADVKIDQQIVGQAKVIVYENMAEAIKALTEEACLKLVNAKARQDAMNKRREKLREESLERRAGKLARKNSNFKAELEALEKKYEVEGRGVNEK